MTILSNPQTGQFQECANCAAKPGSPTLCADCLRRRKFFYAAAAAFNNISGSALEVCTVLQKAGHQAFLVGGCVRDILMGLTPKDWDITTDAHPEVVMKLFPGRTYPTGIAFGTVTIRVGLDSIEVTTFRSDGFSSDGRRPDSVTFSKTIEADLSRRDFTCNAIAFDPISGKLVDPFNGQVDIFEGLLHAVGKASERFREDGLRILRALRFAVTKRFVPSTDIIDGIEECVDMLDNVSKERIRDELLKMLGGGEFNPHPTPRTPGALGAMLDIMQEKGVFAKICPELTKQVGLSQNHHHAWQVWEHTRCCVEGERTGQPLLRLAVLLHDIAKPVTRAPHPVHAGDFQFLTHETLGAEMAEAWMREYKFSKEEIELVSHCIKHHLIFFTPDWTDKQLRRWLRKVGEKHLDELLEVRRADIVGKRPDVSKELEEQDLLKARIAEVSKEVPHSTAHLAIRGNDVMKIRGMAKGGPIIGKIVEHLLEVVTDDPTLNTVEALTPIVERFEG